MLQLNQVALGDLEPILLGLDEVEMCELMGRVDYTPSMREVIKFLKETNPATCTSLIEEQLVIFFATFTVDFFSNI